MGMRRIQSATIAVSFVAIAGFLAASAAEGQKAIVHIDSGKVTFKEVAPGVSKVVLWGDPDKGPYGAFTRFAAGVNNGLHTHSNDIRIVVLEGAYVYEAEKGAETRVSAGQYLFVPGGDRHVSRGDSKAGALFYEESPGKFDLKPVK